jgi:hypothetical protein
LWGIGFEKGWLFELGARPVIYQPREEFPLLDSSISWRHVDYDLRSDVDFSWQREWRIPTRELRFARENVVLVVPEIDVFVSDLWEVFIDVDVSDGEAHLGACTVKKWTLYRLITRSSMTTHRLKSADQMIGRTSSVRSTTVTWSITTRECGSHEGGDRIVRISTAIASILMLFLHYYGSLNILGNFVPEKPDNNLKAFPNQHKS